jgi:hypothetical protein
MKNDANDDLYVGYLPAAPPRVARFVRRVVPVLVIAAAAIAGLLAALQGPFDPGTFEFGTTRAVEGTLLERPYPMLVGEGARGALLVREGKHGAAPDAVSLDGRRVRLEATRVESPLGSMLELVPGTLEPAGVPTHVSSSQVQRLGHVEVTGEIVDSKCFLGVMKPGKGKPHRSCAARCLSGGIPPQLLVVSAEGASRLLLLADAEGGPLAPGAFLDFVGEPVIASGAVERRAGLLVLRLDDALRPAHRP